MARVTEDNLPDIIRTTLRHREGMGYRYREGIFEVALESGRSSFPNGHDAVIDALSATFSSMEYKPSLEMYGG